VAVHGDQVWVAAGTYFPTPTALRAASFVIVDGVSVYGGFAGGETALWQRDPSAHETILSGDLGHDDGIGNVSDNSLHVVKIAGSNQDSLLEGFTVTGGNANGAPSLDTAGGAIHAQSGAAQGEFLVRSCILRGNRCTQEGGALLARGIGRVEDCRFEDNVAGVRGRFCSAPTGGTTNVSSAITMYW